MNARSQVTIDADLQRRAQARAAELGISFAEYVRRLLAQDLGEARRAVDISVVFDLVNEGPASDIANDKDRMIAEAAWEEHTRSTGQVRRARTRIKMKRG
jgi:antitoxin component of RelBE/YafQ-DinJ toxin-antitoxin module